MSPISETECGSCGEVGATPNECLQSKRPCGHHCNHVWTHDECDWCGKAFIEPSATNWGDQAGVVL